MWDAASAQLTATLREASLPTAARQHLRKSIVDFVGGRPIIDLCLANFDLLFCDAYARQVGWRWRKDGLRDAAWSLAATVLMATPCYRSWIQRRYGSSAVLKSSRDHAMF
jgi:hypothetical protein